jgi:inosine-uridine nucleoside N-ribohydrolase
MPSPWPHYDFVVYLPTEDLEMSLTRPALVTLISMLGAVAWAATHAQSGVSKEAPRSQKVIIDTDIGGDIDDAFAVALALQSPEFSILGITTATGDTTMRARLVTRLLNETGRSDIPVAAGIPTRMKKTTPGPEDEDNIRGQLRYGLRTPAQAYPDAVNFILEQIRQNPGEITLITIGPLTNIGAAIDRDAVTFRKVKRVVLMGGSVYLGYDQIRYVKHPQPSAEYNIAADASAAQKLFTSGVPLYVLPVDSTQIKLEELNRAQILTHGTPLTDALALLYLQWSGGSEATPTLYDAMAVTYALAPELCPMTALRLRVDDQGFTRIDQGEFNAQVCLHSDWQKFYDFYIPRVTGPPLKP